MAPKKVPDKQLLKLSKKILDRYPKTFAREAGIDLSRGEPEALFQWLCACMLMSSGASPSSAVKAWLALMEKGWTTPERMLQSSWSERQHVLENAGYNHFKETMAARLYEISDQVLRKYGSDLNNLYDEYDGEVIEIHNALQEFHGLGDAGADVFCREVQLVWPELYPFLDDQGRDYARQLGYPPDAEELAEYCVKYEYPRFLTGIVRAGLENKIEEIKAAA
jgi:endonuclease III